MSVFFPKKIVIRVLVNLRGMLPFGVIEQALRLVNLLLESTPIEQRRAQAVLWFNIWWPFWKLFLNDEQEKQVEKIMQGV